jgi:predicted small metal-binding protein
VEALEVERTAEGSTPMTRQVRCECGFTARGDTDDAVIEKVLVHVAAEHPELAGTETADDIRGWIELLPS